MVVQQHATRTGRKPLVIVLLFCTMLMVLGWAGSARAWWHEEWGFRKKIELDSTAQGGNVQQGLTDFPVLLRLHAGNFDFSRVKQDGGDLRFVAADDQTLLKYQIDTFDVIDEVGLIWVNLPSLAAQSATDFFYLYYGNEKAADSQDGAGTFVAGHSLVYYLAESAGSPQDATARKNHAVSFSGGQALPSVIGQGVALYGGKDHIEVPASPTLNLADGFSFSGWLRINQPVKDGVLLAQGDDKHGIVVGVKNDALYAQVNDGLHITETIGEAKLRQGQWHLVAVTAQPGQKLQVYIDGQKAVAAQMQGLIPKGSDSLFIGSLASGKKGLAVDLDELRISNRVYPASWQQAMAASQGLQANLLSYGIEMEGEGGSMLPTYYLATIAANITMDGWLVIVLLVILGLVSMMVLVSKSFFFYLNRKDNDAFAGSFAQHQGLFCLDGKYEEYENSPLYRIYRNGCTTLTTLFGAEGAEHRRTLDVKEIDMFKNSLEKGYISETKKLNSWMVIMTLAISGGPFLGLLGTVWGVMNTFAALAEAGEANLMAIAPGVASALATTVFGLIVAIPALFGYNYLAAKIKDLTADIGIFIDEFTMRVDGHHGQ